MATNATFNWVPQAGIAAQEVWYGKTSVVGSTFPPAAGWNAGANLYLPSASSALFNNLEENTKYRFLVKSHCLSGDSAWAEYDSYKLVCPSVIADAHGGIHPTSLDLILSIINNLEFSSIVSAIKLDIAPASTGTVVASTTFNGPFASVINYTFSSLTPNTAYNVIVSTVIGGVTTQCSTTPFTTALLLTCPTLTYNISGTTTTSFIINTTNLSVGDNYDVSLDNGATFVQTGVTTTSTTVTGLSGGAVYNLVIRRNCSNGVNSLTTNQAVGTLANNVIVQAQYGIGIASVTGGGLPGSLASANLPSGSTLNLNVPTITAGTISVVLSGSPFTTTKIILYVDNVQVSCLAVPGSGTYNLSLPSTVNYPSTLKVAINIGTC